MLGPLAPRLDRQGHTEQARGDAAEAGGAWSLTRTPGKAPPGKAPPPPSARNLPELPEGEEHAVVAVLAEKDGPELARERWQAFLDSPAGKGPWASHARKRLDALKARRGKAR